MEPVPSTKSQEYPPRGPLQQFRFVEATAFVCFRCGTAKKAKLIAVYGGDWGRRLCNGCYGRLLSVYEIKSGGNAASEKADNLAIVLLAVVSADEQRRAAQRIQTSESRAQLLSGEAIRFLATSEHVAAQLQEVPGLEWSPAVIGLCKATEVEIVRRILVPLSGLAIPGEFALDKGDKDFGRISAFCAEPTRKPPELGTFAHFLGTAINSKERRQSSPTIKALLRLLSEWPESHWILDSSGLLRMLGNLTSEFRNRAAHIDELGMEDYRKCFQLVAGDDGMLWRLIAATSVR